ncbi:MAG: hypothetical protein OEW92_11920, partial [Gammaproteobacteria bacterium]|nr:hypothetical protein [Gammaproteobacteria bacterium]
MNARRVKLLTSGTGGVNGRLKVRVGELGGRLPGECLPLRNIPLREWRETQSIQDTVYSQSASDASASPRNSPTLLYGIDSTAIHGPSTGRSFNKALVITPVNPIPPTVAAYQSALSPGPQS